MNKRQTKLVGILVSVLMFGYSGIGWAVNLSLEKVYSIKTVVQGTVSDHATEIKPALIGDDIRIGGGLTIIKYPSNGESRIAYSLPKVVDLKPRHVKIYAYDGSKKERPGVEDEKPIVPNTQNFNDFFEGVYPSGVVVSSFVEENFVIDVFTDKKGEKLIRRLSAVNPGLGFEVVGHGDGASVLEAINIGSEEIEITRMEEVVKKEGQKCINNGTDILGGTTKTIEGNSQASIEIQLDPTHSSDEEVRSLSLTIKIEYKKGGVQQPPVELVLIFNNSKALKKELDDAKRMLEIRTINLKNAINKLGIEDTRVLELERTVAEARASFDDLQANYTRIEKELEEERAASRHENEELREELINLQEKIIQEGGARLEQESQHILKCQELTEQLHDSEVNIKNKSQEIIEMQQKLSEVQQVLENNLEEIAQLKKELEQKDDEIKAQKDMINTQTSTISEMSIREEENKRKLERLGQKMLKLEIDASTTIAERQAEVDRLRAENGSINSGMPARMQEHFAKKLKESWDCFVVNGYMESFPSKWTGKWDSLDDMLLYVREQGIELGRQESAVMASAVANLQPPPKQ
ncbi:MAG: hypothetical protein ACD_21C00286G0005 [uncultured bacterium]|nr:MAG: hypothetical protein ACD_21C00286G0005 [uncultured bacterium]